MSRGAISELDRLLAEATPVLQADEFVFVSVKNADVAAGLQPLGTFCEAEGVSVICRRASANVAGLAYDGVFRRITLEVHSSLRAVGFLAALASALAEQGIACNAVSAVCHDHLFVPAPQADAALIALKELSAPCPKRR